MATAELVRRSVIVKDMEPEGRVPYDVYAGEFMIAARGIEAIIADQQRPKSNMGNPKKRENVRQAERHPIDRTVMKRIIEEAANNGHSLGLTDLQVNYRSYILQAAVGRTSRNKPANTRNLHALMRHALITFDPGTGVDGEELSRSDRAREYYMSEVDKDGHTLLDFLPDTVFRDTAPQLFHDISTIMHEIPRGATLEEFCGILAERGVYVRMVEAQSTGLHSEETQQIFDAAKQAYEQVLDAEILTD